MIDRIVDFSIRNKVIVFATVAGAALLGWWSIRHAPLDAIPDLSDVQVIVYAEWPGRSPDLVPTACCNRSSSTTGAGGSSS